MWTKYLFQLAEVISSCNWARNFKVPSDLTCFEDGGQSSIPVSVLNCQVLNTTLKVMQIIWK